MTGLANYQLHCTQTKILFVHKKYDGHGVRNRVIMKHMSKYDRWFRSLIEAFEQDPSWEVDLKETASEPSADRAKPTKSKEKK